MKLSRIGAYGLAVKEGKVLLLKKMGGPYLGLLDLPGGGIEKDEGPLDALSREFMEELCCSFAAAQFLMAGYCCFCSDEIEFHQYGMIYLVYDLQVMIGPPEEPFTWYSFADIEISKLTPLAIQALKYTQTT